MTEYIISVSHHLLMSLDEEARMTPILGLKNVKHEEGSAISHFTFEDETSLLTFRELLGLDTGGEEE